MNKNIIKKIYISIIALILVISISIGVGYANQNNINATGNNQTSIDDMEDMFEDNDEPQHDTDDDTTVEQPKTYTNGYLCVSDAINRVVNGKGYKYVLNLTATGTVFGISETQYVQEKVSSSNNYYLKESFARATTSLGERFYRYFYSNDNGQNVEYKKTTKVDDSGVPDWSGIVDNKVVDKKTISNEVDMQIYQPFSIIPNKTNSTLIKFDRVSSKTYYIVALQFDISKTPDEYIQNAKKNGGLESLTMKSLKLTFYIEKNTNYLRKIEKNENYAIKKGVVIDTISYQEQIFTAVDKQLEIVKP